MYRLGIGPGYIITKINNKNINSIQDINNLKEKYGDEFENSIESIEYIDDDFRLRSLVLR